VLRADPIPLFVDPRNRRGYDQAGDESPRARDVFQASLKEASLGALAGALTQGAFAVDFHNRHVIVTGGAGALGTAVVGTLIELGAICHVPCYSQAEAQRFAHRDSSAVKLSVPGDLAEQAAVEQLFGAVPELWASIHLAGGFAAAAIGATNRAMLMQQLHVNLVSAFLCCRAAVGAMVGRGGRIVNVAARAALEGRSGAGMTAYAASKAALATLTIALAEEVAQEQILVNAVAPSVLDTPANRQAMPKANFEAWPKVEEVAATIVFLASPDNRVTRGAVVPVYGRA
jgi:NAD(P)-dependent dehydrogenase (short-subunit alcohol dehydrogenase family)